MAKIFKTKLYLAFEKLMAKLFFTWKVKRETRQELTRNLIEDYEELIKEYRLIQEKKSKLSKSGRDNVIRTVNFLVEKGHLKVN